MGYLEVKALGNDGVVRTVDHREVQGGVTKGKGPMATQEQIDEVKGLIEEVKRLRKELPDSFWGKKDTPEIKDLLIKITGLACKYKTGHNIDNSYVNYDLLEEARERGYY